ncbi:MAG TPA: hypothetical protein VMS96_14740 [Terriglobales bacterium]|nr:hypothetical protein [Terriglobales bacterium]
MGRRTSSLSSRRLLLAAALFLAVLPGQAQQEPKGIQDNSFLIEEAYNQEKGVIQHISGFSRLWPSRDWGYSFTEEWPVPGHEKHQLSATINLVSPGDSSTGMGDCFFNYRYQLVGNGEARVAVAPRLSLLLPTGSASQGRGFGGPGLQISLPASVVVVDRHLVTHWNAGATFVPSARGAGTDRAAVIGYNLGQSVVWLAHPRFNVLLETVWNASQAVAGPDTTVAVRSLLLNPGMRWAYNFKNGLQIVPGVGVPIGVGPSAGEKGIFLYLSFEHPLGAAR